MAIIIVTGFLATLKTTISKRLAEDLNIISINKDDLKEILVDTVGYNSRQENLKLSEVTFQLIKDFSRKYKEQSKDLIIEANFKSHELNELKKLHTHDILTVFLYGEPNILYDRYSTRQENRHFAHTSTGLISFKVFQESMKEYKIESCFGEVIPIDTTYFSQNDYSDLLKKIKLFLN